MARFSKPQSLKELVAEVSRPYPEVGNLMRDGRIVYYVFIDGKKVERLSPSGIFAVMYYAKANSRTVGL